VLCNSTQSGRLFIEAGWLAGWSVAELVAQCALFFPLHRDAQSSAWAKLI